jgi:hypothetical protein
LNKPLVGETLTCRSLNETVEPRHGVVLHIRFVEAERNFVNEALKVLRAGVVANAIQTALENGQNALNPFCSEVNADILARAMIDGVVIETGEPLIDVRIVGVDSGACLDVSRNRGSDGRRVHVVNRTSDHFSAALTHAEYGGLSDRAITGVEFLAGVLAGRSHDGSNLWTA